MGGYLEHDHRFLDRPDKTPLATWRVVIGFVLAPISAAIALSAFEAVYFQIPGGQRFREAIALYAFGAFPTAIILGIPAFLILKKLVRATLLACAATGAVIGALPWFLFGLIPQRGYNAWTDGKPTVIDGEMTPYGWLQFVEFLLLIAAAGAVGGALFWIIAAGRSERGPRAN
jgi:hypothetical protein